jgi:FOG: WD40-like repeat
MQDIIGHQSVPDLLSGTFSRNDPKDSLAGGTAGHRTKIPPHPKTGIWILLVIFIAGLVLCPVVSADTMFRYDAARSGNYTIPAVATGTMASVLWQTPVAGGPIRSSPAVANNVVYIGDTNGYFNAFNATTGVPLWISDLNRAIISSPAVANNTIYVGCMDGALYGFNVSDSIIFAKPGLTAISSSPAVANGVVYFGTKNGYLRAFNTTAGDFIWSSSLGGAVKSSPAVVNNIVYVGDMDGGIWAIRAKDGSAIWQKVAMEPVSSSPAVVNGVVYVGTEQGNVYALNANTGAILWNYTTKSRIVDSSPAVANGTVYIGAENGYLYALNASTGAFVWKSYLGGAIFSSPAVADDIVYVGSTAGGIWALNANTGQAVWQKAATEPVSSSPVVVNGIVYIGTQNGNVYAINTHPSNVRPFGDKSQITYKPGYEDYVSVGGASAIRRDGTLETFIGGINLSGNNCIQVTNGAAITTNGQLITWTPGFRTISPDTTAETASKRYVAISQYSDNDWLLAIYKDANGATHLEARGNYTGHPEVFGRVPTDTGWKLIAAGKDHALAVRSNGTLVAWGKNPSSWNQLSLTARYTDIAAGDDFSLGLINGTQGVQTTIVASGKDGSSLVSDAPKLPDTYLAIDAGPSTGAALTHDGHILIWGKNIPGVPSDAGYTDITLGRDIGFALKEPIPEVHIDQPVSPGKPVSASNGFAAPLPANLVIWHTHNEVTRVFDPDGKEIFWTNDNDVPRAQFPSGTSIPIDLVHYVDSGSDVNSATDYRVIVSAPGSSGTPTIDLHEDTWYRENNGSLPQAVCFANDCSAGVSTKQQLYLSRPLSPITNGRIPVFSIKQLSDNSYVGTLSILGSTNPADTTSIQIEKSAFNPTRTINFSIMSGNWGNGTGTNVQETALATLTPMGPVLNYTVTATASQPIPSIQITPQIWKKAAAGDTRVYTGSVATCPQAAQCIASGNFTPPDAATYYTNASVLYTLPATTADGVTVETRQNVIAAASGGTTPSVNQVTDIEGTHDDYPDYDYYKDNVQYAQQKQIAKGYSAEAYFQPKPSILNSRFPNDYIIFFNGHSSPGLLNIGSPGSGAEGIYCAQGCPGRQFADISLTYARFVMFLSCNSSDTSQTQNGNLVDMANQRGADCVFGYHDKLTRTPSISYSQAFWDAAANGQSWINAAQAGLNNLLDKNYWCHTTTSNDCGYSTLRKVGGSACSFVMAPHKSIEVEHLPENLTIQKNIGQAKFVIQNFTGLPLLNLSYVETVHGDAGMDSYRFSSDIGVFSVNAQTGRVQNALFLDPPYNSPNEIDLDQAYLIALNYAQQRYPALWQTTEQKGVQTFVAERRDHGDYYDYDFIWRDEYPVTDNKSGSQYAVSGPNSASVTLTSSGAIRDYYERVVTIDPSLDLVPDISESQAQVIAVDALASQGAPNVEKSTAQDLVIFSDVKTGKQHLAWQFEMYNSNGYGGHVWIDAHDGSVVFSALV